MTSISSNNKRIAKNTILLYFRMIVTTLVSLYTARLTLQLLGVEDFGIYNVVAGIVNFTGIFTATMVQATQRFMSVDIGNNDLNNFKKTFSMTTNIFLIVSLVCVFVFEIVGIILINQYLVIPEPRLLAAHLIFQFALVDFVLTTMTITYNAAVVSHEKMGVYAYFTFVDVFFKLLVVFSLFVTPIDKLVTYGGLGVFACVARNYILYAFCKKNVSGCEYIRYWDGSYFKKMFSYMGWSFLGSTSRVMTIQGQAILLNLFFGPVVNAAKAIADKINAIIYSFVSNFYMAVSPQIIKSYTTKDFLYTKKLVLTSSKLGYYLLLIISVPLICNMEGVLNIWLGSDQVSGDMILFCQLILIYSLVNALESPITKVVQASGQVKSYELWVGSITLLFIPTAFLLFKLDLPAYSSLVLLIVVYSIAHIYRVVYVSKLINISLLTYWSNVVFPVLSVTVVTLLITYNIHIGIQNDIFLLSINLVLNLMITVTAITLLGLNKNEKNITYSFIKKRILKK